ERGKIRPRMTMEFYENQRLELGYMVEQLVTQTTPWEISRLLSFIRTRCTRVSNQDVIDIAIMIQSLRRAIASWLYGELQMTPDPGIGIRVHKERIEMSRW